MPATNVTPEIVTFRNVRHTVDVDAARNPFHPDREIVTLTEIGKRGREIKRGYVAHRLPSGEIVNAIPTRF